jgi:hypothetical protein
VLFTAALLISLDSPPERSAIKVPYFQLLLSPALLQTCYLLFACFASCNSACSPDIIKSAADAAALAIAAEV